jgi:hypothetical protein
MRAARSQRAVATEGEHRVHLARHDEPSAGTGDVPDALLVRQRQVERRRETLQRRENAGQSFVSEVTGDAEADHPASASLS